MSENEFSRAILRLPDDPDARLEDVLSAYIDDCGSGARPFLEDLAAIGYFICQMSGGVHSGTCPTCGCRPLVDKYQEGFGP
jgi:hypothetical protein